MRVNLTQENLHKALNVVTRIVGNRATLPVLSNVLLSTEANRIKLSSTNLEIGINYWFGAKVEQEGALTIPARLLSDYVASLPAGNIELTSEKDILTLKTDHHQSSINGISAAEFPSIPKINQKHNLHLPAQSFKQALTQVVVAASIDDARPVLNGVYLFNQDDQLIVVATDSYRLAEKKLDLPKTKNPLSDFKTIIPARTMQEVLRIIEDDTEVVDLFIEDNQVLFKIGEVELVSRLIEGQFPDYQALIPAKTETQSKLLTSDFTNITKIAALFARENAGSVNLKIDAATKTLSIRSIASQVGENTSESSAEVTGDSAEVSLNCRYLLEALAVINHEKLSFGITGKVNPCLMRAEGDNSYLHIIMPLRS